MTILPLLSPSPQRFHSLDALRAFVLLLGVSLHMAAAFILPHADWAIRPTEQANVPALFCYYVHCFRLEVFFLLAGFFARLVIEKRGVRAFLQDRAVRIVLVFAVALYPMKLLLSACWVIGGLHTGALQLPPESATLPWWQLALDKVTHESWPAINLTHLWFLYTLACITLLFLVLRWSVSLVVRPGHALRTFVQGSFRRAVGSPFVPFIGALVALPLLASMTGFDIDTPIDGFSWHVPVLALYGVFFAFGWMLHRHRDLLEAFARRWVVFLPLSLFVGFVAATGVGFRMSGNPWVAEHATLLRWATAFGTGLTMCLAVAGWLGLFAAVFNRHRPWVRYLADSAYWIYLVHLPLVFALQIAFSDWEAPWWVQLPLIHLIVFPLLLLSYQLMVRKTWIGRWLNGRRAPSLQPGQTVALSRSARP
jgi:hypothetical protein